MITEKKLIRIHFMCYLLLLVYRLSSEIRHIGQGILLAGTDGPSRTSNVSGSREISVRRIVPIHGGGMSKANAYECIFEKHAILFN